MKLDNIKIGDWLYYYSANDGLRIDVVVKSIEGPIIEHEMLGESPHRSTHHKFFRGKIIQKSRREIFINEYDHGLNQAWHKTQEEADLSAVPGRIRSVRFVEARKKKET